MSPHKYSRDVWATHGEFFRLLPGALGSADYRVDGRDITYVAGQGKETRITLGPEGKRQIALMVIPITPVSIELVGYSDDEAATFMKLFDRG